MLSSRMRFRCCSACCNAATAAAAAAVAAAAAGVGGAVSDAKRGAVADDTNGAVAGGAGGGVAAVSIELDIFSETVLRRALPFGNFSLDIAPVKRQAAPNRQAAGY